MRGKFFLLFVFLIFLLLGRTVFALSVTPARVSGNFVPGFEKTISYSISEQDASQDLNIYIEGDLKDYIQLDKNKLKGGGTFSVTIKLPQNISKPGHHKTYVVVEEAVKDDEVLDSPVGTSITLKSLIDIFVPYPGKYIEVSLDSGDVNVGEPVNFKLGITSFGKEDVNMTPRIEIFKDNSDIPIDVLSFRNRELKSMGHVKLGKPLNTFNYTSGNYNAVAIVDYGTAVAKDESKFRVGELVIKVINYTHNIVIDGLKPFYLNIESGWNDKIDGAYGEVVISKDENNSISFKTSSTSLMPWENKKISGFFDTSDFKEGTYPANITIFYYGNSVGKSSSKVVDIKFIKKQNKIYLLIAILIVLAILIIFSIKIFHKKDGKKKKRKKR